MSGVEGNRVAAAATFAADAASGTIPGASCSRGAPPTPPRRRDEARDADAPGADGTARATARHLGRRLRLRRRRLGRKSPRGRRETRGPTTRADRRRGGEVPREGTETRAFRDIVGVRTGDVLVAASLFDAPGVALSSSSARHASDDHGRSSATRGKGRAPTWSSTVSIHARHAGSTYATDVPEGRTRSSASRDRTPSRGRSVAGRAHPVGAATGSVGEVSPRAHLPERGGDDVERRREDHGGDDGLLGERGRGGRGVGMLLRIVAPARHPRPRLRSGRGVARRVPTWIAQVRLRSRSSSRSKYVASPSSCALDGSDGMLRGAGEWRGATSSDFSLFRFLLAGLDQAEPGGH